MTGPARRPAKIGLVTFDLDGTLTTVHGWKFIAESTGRLAEFEASNRRFFAGEIDEDQHLKNLLDLAVGLRIGEIHQLLERTPRVAGIAETLNDLHRRGIHSALLTHNPSYVCDWYQRRFGFQSSEGTGGTVLEGDRIAGSGPSKASKLVGLARLAAQFDLPLTEIVHVGDGRADAMVFERVGAGIAFNSRLADVEARADVALRSATLTSILPVLDGWTRSAPR